MACARKATICGCEHPPHATRGMGRPAPPPTVPALSRRGSQRPPHVLLGCVCARMETAHRSRLPARTSLPARPRRLRAMRPGYRSPAQGQAQAGLRRPPPIRETLGPAPPPLGRRPHRACRGRRRRMRPRQHAHALPAMPPRRHRRAAAAPATSSNQSRGARRAACQK